MTDFVTSDLACPPFLDAENLERMVAEGFINRQVGGPGNRFTLYNYTPRAAYGRVWNQETLACRGLVVRDDGAVQSRPFAKFFNVSEHTDCEFLPPLPLEPFEVYEKLDGSLIVASALEWRPELPLLTTRGSFASEQAVAAGNLWAMDYWDVRIPAGETWLFEFIGGRRARAVARLACRAISGRPAHDKRGLGREAAAASRPS